jgi:hypothetical protein
LEGWKQVVDWKDGSRLLIGGMELGCDLRDGSRLMIREIELGCDLRD